MDVSVFQEKEKKYVASIILLIFLEIIPYWKEKMLTTKAIPI